MKLDADLHNFGQKVAQVGRGSDIYFQKPRPIFWEWFFFGINSPLKTIFNDKEFSSGIFNLKVEMSDNFTGLSKRVCEVDTLNADSHSYHLGALLAYCYIFGIRDLHKGNVIRTSSHLQVIDAEVVLTKLLLPNETLLLPFRETPFSISAAKKFFEDQEAISILHLKKILDGYFDLFSVVLKKYDALIDVFEQHREKMRSVPIRHIMRDTVHYRNYLEDQTRLPPVPFCKNEITQLERGDVPYYFKFIDDTALYSYTAVNGDYAPINEIPSDFIKGIERAACCPLELLTLARLQDNLLPTGSLFLLKKLIPHEIYETIKGDNFKAVVSPENIEINFLDKTFLSKRFR